MWPLEVSDLLLIAVIAIDCVAILRALTRSHGLQRTLTWILAVLAFPILGALLYMTLANPSIKRTTRRMGRGGQSLRESGEGGVARTPGDLDESSRESPYEQVFTLATRLTGLDSSRASEVQLLSKDEHAMRRLEEAIQAARHTIWVEYYIVRNDETGRRFMDLLASQAARGIEVRLLYDAFGSWWINSRRVRAIREAGGRVEAFLPLNPLRRRWSVNLRNHRKIVVVDGELGFTGGMNIGDEYSGRARRKGLKGFRDTHLELRGSAVTDLARVFAEDWVFATHEHLSVPENSAAPTRSGPRVSIVPSGPDQEHNATELVYFACVNAARKRLWLSSPYLLPDDTMLRALVAAALRGVDVRIVAPRRADVLVATLAARATYPEFHRAGVRIFEYLPTMMHAKTLLVDDSLALVGSANVDVRSFALNFELSALIEDEPFAGELGRQFEEDMQSSREYTRSSESFPQRVLHGVARLFAPLL
jgi:cardiolipin synthase